MDNIMLLVIGLLLTILGIMNMCGNITSIHSYHRTRVKDEDVLQYGKAVGLGTVLMGIGLMISFFLLLFQTGINIGYVIMPTIVIGLVMIVYGQFKYNNGIF